MVLRDEDIVWLSEHHPALLLQDGALRGPLSFSMVYDPLHGSYTIDPPLTDQNNPDLIYHSDVYRVEILLDEGRSYPIIKEMSDKIAVAGKRLRTSPGGMHLNSDGSFCLEANQELQERFHEGFDIEVYINEYVIPYLFEQTHKRLTGEWAWRPRGHYLAGPLEWYYERADKRDTIAAARTLQTMATITKKTVKQIISELTSKRYTRSMPCLCDSGKSVISCCPHALYGYKKLRKHIFKIAQS
jgi:hypothetical protein